MKWFKFGKSKARDPDIYSRAYSSFIGQSPFILGGTKLDHRSELGSGLFTNSSVFSIIGWVAEQLVECPFELQKEVDGTFFKEENSLPSVLSYPNDVYDDSFLWGGVVLDLVSNGTAYWFKRKNRLDKLVGFWWIPYSSVVRKVTGSEIEYFTIENGQEIPRNREDLVIFNTNIPNPDDPFRSMALVDGVLREITASNEASTAIASLFRNSANPSVIIAPKTATDSITDVQLNALKRLWQRFTGDSRGLPLTLPLDATVTKVTFSPVDADVVNVMAILSSIICAALKIDPMVIGLPSKSKTYSNYEEAMRAAFYNCIIPLMRKCGRQLLRQVHMDIGVPLEGYRCGWNLDQVQCLQESQDQLHDRLRKNWESNGITHGEFRRAIGLNPDSATKNLYHAEFLSTVSAGDRPAD